MLLVSLLGGIGAPLTFFGAYLVGFLFLIGLSLGAMAVVMLYHLTGGDWGRAAQRPLEAATLTLPWLAIGFLPLAIGWQWLYPWAHPDAHQAVVMPLRYLNGPFMLLRTAICFGIWLWLMARLTRQVEQADPGPPLRALSAPGLILWGLTVTLSVIDWVMSLYPGWMSTVFGFMFLTGQGISGFALAIVAGAWLSGRPDYRPLLHDGIWRDWGNLLLMAVMLWAYAHLSQLIIIWSGNLPDEIGWYLTHLAGNWRGLTILIAVAGFALPFALLLFRPLKDRPERLTAIALLLLVGRGLELYWQVVPALPAAAWQRAWLYGTVPAGLILLWVAAYRRAIGRRPLVPPAEPRPEWGHHG